MGREICEIALARETLNRLAFCKDPFLDNILLLQAAALKAFFKALFNFSKQEESRGQINDKMMQRKRQRDGSKQQDMRRLIRI